MVGEDSVSRAALLKRLAQYGLAVHRPDGWVRGPVTPSEVASLFSSFGAARRQKQQHDTERSRYRDDAARRARRGGRLTVVDHQHHRDADTSVFAMAA
jgi:hypothetical protein